MDDVLQRLFVKDKNRDWERDIDDLVGSIWPLAPKKRLKKKCRNKKTSQPSTEEILINEIKVHAMWSIGTNAPCR